MLVLIWTGFGIVWPVAFGFGFMVGASLSAEYAIGVSPPLVGIWSGVVIAFLFTRGFDYDEHTFFFVPLSAWTFISLIGAIGFTLYTFRESAITLDHTYDLPTKTRIWRDDKGREIKAILEDVIVERNNKQVAILVRDDGKRFRFDFERLDQDGEFFVEKCLREKTKRQ